MSTQLAILQNVVTFCLHIFVYLIPVMIAVEVMLEYGVLNKMTDWAGKFLGSMANLPRDAAVPFMSSFGSSYVAGAMLLNLQARGILQEREIFVAALSFSLPFYIREIFSYYLPIVMPLLGLTLGSIYLLIHTTLILVRMIFTIVVGKTVLPPVSSATAAVSSVQAQTTDHDFARALNSALHNTRRPLQRMLITIPLSALLVFELNTKGVFGLIPVQAQALGLPACSNACLLAYLANSTAGLTAVAACFSGGQLDLIQAARTLVWQCLLAAPISMVRFSTTYYVGIYGPKLGTKLALCALGLNILAYLACLAVISYVV